MIQVSSKDLKLIGPGAQYVQTVLKELNDNDLPAGWKLGTIRKVAKRVKYKKEKPDGDSTEENTETSE